LTGSVLVEGFVGDGLGGVLPIAVGVGTGGSVSVGTGDPESAADGAAAALVTALTGVPATDDATATGLGPRDDQSTIDSDSGVVAFGGAAPIPPAAPGALTGGGAGDGVPSVQPTVTANGRPKATMPKKIDLGESRTP
jgi:hypothetical protein